MKKILSVLLILSMLLSFVPLSALAATTGSYGVDLSSDGYGSINIYNKPQCTWYCWGRTYELYGVKFPNFGNAKDWYSNASAKGYSVGTTCKVGSIAVFKDIGSDTSGYGHVAYVEKISGSTAYISEGNYGGTTYHEGTYNCSTGKRFAGTSDEQQIVGYIYPSGTSDSGTTVSVSFSDNSKASVSTTNAVLAKTISVSGAAISAVSKVGVRLYNSSGTQLGSKFETPTSSNGVINAWYDVNSELGVTLDPSTTYKYRFYATVNGTEYPSDYYSFTTDSDGVTATYTTYTSKYSVGTTNAVLAKTLSVSGTAITNVTKVGIKLYNSSGTLLGSKTETPTPKDGVINIWYDVNSELGVTLTPNTTYKYQFHATINGLSYPSSTFSFTTSSTGVTTKFTTYTTKYSVGTTNAVLAKTLSVSGTAITNVTKVGIKLYNAAGTTLLGSKTETPTPKDGVINIWYDVNSELGVTLTPGTTYKYVMTAVISGVTYTSEDFSFTTTPIYVTSVTLNKSSLALDVTTGTTGTITATVAPSNATNKNVNWSSSNTAVATVSGGVVTPRSVGTATITATAADGSGKKATCTVTVTAQLNLNAIITVGDIYTAKTGQSSTWVAEAAGGVGDVTYKFIVWYGPLDETPEGAGEIYNTGWISEPTLTYTYTKPGNYTCQVWAMDSADSIEDGPCSSGVVKVTQAVESLVLDRTSVVLADEGHGSQLQLNCEYLPEDADVGLLSWSSNNTSVVTVTSSGVLTAQAAGSATVTVTADSGVSAACEVTVKADMTTLTLPASTLTVEKEAFLNSSAYERVILPEGLQTIGANAFRNASSLRYVYIPQSVTLIGDLAFEGCPEVLILCEEGSAAESYAIDQGLPYMTPVDMSAAVPVQQVTLSASAYTLTAGESFTLTAAVAPSDATDQRIVWSSSNNAVASVSDGVVTAITAGSATITAASADGNARASCEVTVEPVLVSSITLNTASLTLDVGDTFYLDPTILPVEASGLILTWKSSDETVATVANGYVTAVGSGSAEITAYANDGSNATASCSVTVNPVLLSSIVLSDTSIELLAGQTYTLSATAYPADADNPTIIWASNNAAVATVTASGVVTGKASGTTTIQASADDGSGVVAYCTVNVTTKQQAAGVVQHPVITSANAWYRLYPTIDHLSFGETTNTERYAAIIDQFDVTWGEGDEYVDGWYEPGTTYHGSTYCNYFAVDVAYAMGCFIPIANTCENCGCPVGSSAVKSHTADGTIYTSTHYLWTGITNYGMNCSCDNRSIPSGWSTNRLYTWFMGADGDPDNANASQFCWVACSAAEAVEAANSGYMTVGLNTGHIFVVYPHGGSAMYISQAGSNLMSNEAMPYTQSDYKYFYNIGGV